MWADVGGVEEEDEVVVVVGSRGGSVTRCVAEGKMSSARA